ncbi:MAG: CPBP family intramembrane glutamic endopeptidase [bacterium]
MTNIPSKRLMLVQIFLIFILPVFLIYFNILPVSWRMVLLAICSLMIYGIISRENWSFEDLGLHHHNYKKAIPFYASFAVLGVLILFFIHHETNAPDIESRIFFIKTFAFFIPISVFQEFAFRSFLIPRLKMIYKNEFFIIFFNAILFTLIHIIYPNWGIGLPLAFFSGVFFAWLYIKYPNLVLISITHAILNITAVLLGFFVIVK